jgi:hypothetical protein
MSIESPTNDVEMVYGAPDLASAAEYIEQIRREARNQALDEAATAVANVANQLGADSHQGEYYAHKRAVAMAIDAVRELKTS